MIEFCTEQINSHLPPKEKRTSCNRADEMEYVFNLRLLSCLDCTYLLCICKTERPLLLHAQVLHYSDGSAVSNAERDPPVSQAADHTDSKWWPAAASFGHSCGGPLATTHVKRVSGEVTRSLIGFMSLVRQETMTWATFIQNIDNFNIQQLHMICRLLTLMESSQKNLVAFSLSWSELHSRYPTTLISSTMSTLCEADHVNL